MGAPAEGIEKQRIRCGALRDLLREFARIHVQIDTPNRTIHAESPDWILCLRKVCRHALAISACDIDADGVHTMATELRAAYWQMHAVWPCVPAEHRVVEMDGSWWASEARDEVLARYDHPTPLSLSFSLKEGGFDQPDEPISYVRLVLWLGRLGFGYGLALTYLAEVLDVEGDFDSQVTELLQRSARVLDPR